MIALGLWSEEVVWVKNRNDPDEHLLIPVFQQLRRPSCPMLAMSGPAFSRWLGGSEVLASARFPCKEHDSLIVDPSRSFTAGVLGHVT